MYPDPRQGAQAHDGDERGAAQQQNHLDTLRHHHCFQSAQRCIGDGKQRQNNDGGKHRYAEQRLEDFCRGKEADSDVNEQRTQDPDDC